MSKSNDGNEPKRWLSIEYTDKTSLQIPIAKCTTLKMGIRKVGIHIDHIGDGQYIIVANDSFLPEGKKLDCIRVVREEDQRE